MNIPTKVIFFLVLVCPFMGGYGLTSESTTQDVTTTVIDILSENVEFSSFLRILQRNQLIPFLNELTNITLIAPVNSAFVNMGCENLDDKNCRATIVKKFSLNDLKRYIIDQPITSGEVEGSQIYRSFFGNGSPVLVEAETEDLEFRINGYSVVEPNLVADSQDSVVQGIEKVFDDLKTVSDLLGEIPEVSQFQELLDLATTYNQTLLVPENKALNFKEYEFNYLKSDYGIDDTSYLINSLSIDGLYGGNINQTATSKNGFRVFLSSEDDGLHLVVNNTFTSKRSNIISEDSIIHIFDDQSLVPEIEFTPLKAMIGLNSSVLVDELKLQKLTHLITNNSIEQTIFIPTDPSQMSITSQNSNLYHFVDERIKDLRSPRALYNSRFCGSKKLGQHCQRIKIEETEDKKILLNDNIEVQDGPYEVGKTLIYLIDEDLRTPNEISSSIHSVLHCSESLKIMQKLGLLKLSNNGLGYTFFLPCYNAWDDFDLTMNYFAKNKTALDELMKNFILNGLVYTDFSDGATKLENMNGQQVTISNVGEPDDERLNLKYNDIDVSLVKSDDILFNQGVVHPIESLFFPLNSQISMRKIIASSKAEVFMKYISFFPDLDDALNQNNYSVLLPSEKSLEKIDFSNSNNTLEKFLKLHIIHPSSIEHLYDCSSDIQTLLEGVNLTCSRISGRGDMFLEIDGGSDNGVRILSKGCANTEHHNCVYAIDKPISLSWIDDHTHYHLNLPGVALAIGLMGGIVVMIFVFVCLMIFVAGKKNSFLSGAEHNEAEHSATETSPLLPAHEEQIYEDQREGRSNFENQYSTSTVVSPIAVSKKNNGAR